MVNRIVHPGCKFSIVLALIVWRTVPPDPKQNPPGTGFGLCFGNYFRTHVETHT